MFDILSKYENHGHFFFKPGERLIEVSRDVPNKPGVYYIMRLANGNFDLVYIGKSGTFLQNGKFKNQLLRNRINNKQNGIRRQEFFDLKMQKESIEALDIYWYVTFDNNHQEFPGYIEGILIQQYYEIYGSLPPWNKQY